MPISLTLMSKNEASKKSRNGRGAFYPLWNILTWKYSRTIHSSQPLARLSNFSSLSVVSTPVTFLSDILSQQQCINICSSLLICQLRIHPLCDQTVRLKSSKHSLLQLLFKFILMPMSKVFTWSKKTSIIT